MKISNDQPSRTGNTHLGTSLANQHHCHAKDLETRVLPACESMLKKYQKSLANHDANAGHKHHGHQHHLHKHHGHQGHHGKAPADDDTPVNHPAATHHAQHAAQVGHPASPDATSKSTQPSTRIAAPAPRTTVPATQATTVDARQTLDAGHGWGAQNGGVTGGSKADNAHVYTVSTRAELLAALGGNNASNGANATPKIIKITGNIDLNADDHGKPLTKADFANEKAQLDHDMLTVGSNTTIIGVGPNAGISGGGFNVNDSHNVIIRNLNMSTPFDFFPGKDDQGNPHGRVYSIEAKGTQNLWVDHNTFNDGKAPAGAISGDQIDFTNGANFATISNNQFLSHNKSILIGSSDGRTSDAGKLNVTIDHNLFDGVSQRDPRVRYGNVEVANNLYRDSSSQTNRFQYNLGVGVHSDITSQNNAFETQGVGTGSLVKRFGDSGHLSDSGSLVNGKAVDLSSSPSGKGPGGGAIAHLDATADVASIVLAQSGAGKLKVGA